jgi:hypothetical protein
MIFIWIMPLVVLATALAVYALMGFRPQGEFTDNGEFYNGSLDGLDGGDGRGDA